MLDEGVIIDGSEKTAPRHIPNVGWRAFLKNVALETGREVPSSGNALIWLGSADTVHVVTAGHCDVFAVPLDHNNDVIGKRTYLFTANEGEMLFGIDPMELLQPIALVAVGNVQTAVHCFSMEKMYRDKALREVFVHAVDHWVEALSKATVTFVVPKPRFQRSIQAGSQLTLAEYDRFGTTGDVAWLVGPNDIFFSDTNVIDEGSEFFPLAPSAWLSSIAEINCQTKTTRQIVDIEAVSVGLIAFHHTVLSGIGTNVRLSLADEFNLYNDREHLNRGNVEAALKRVVEVVGQKLDGPNLRSENDLLTKAITFASEQMHAKRPVLQSFETSLPTEERLLRLLGSAQIRSREISLVPELAQFDGNVIVAFRKGETDDHPVILFPIGRKGYFLFDPATEKQLRVTTEIIAELSLGAYALYPTLLDDTLEPWPILKFCFREAAPDMRAMLIFAAIGGLLGLAIPPITAVLMNTAIPNSEMTVVLELATLLVALSLSTAILSLVQSAASLRMSTLVESKLQAAIWDRMMSLPVNFFKDYAAGDLTDRAMSISTIRGIVSGGMLSTTLAAVFASVNFGLMLYFSIEMTMVAVAVTFLTAIISLASSLYLLRITRMIIKEEGLLANRGLQSISSMATLRSTGSEKRAFSRWLEHFAKVRRLDYHSSYVELWITILTGWIPMATIMAFYVIMAGGLVQAPPSLGSFIAFNAAFGAFQGGILALLGLITDFLEIKIHWERFEPIRNNAPEVHENALPAGELKGKITISHLRHRYDKDGPVVLDDIDLNIEAGQFVAFVGPSGSGKTTLLRILLGFEKPENGAVFYDSKDLANLDLTSVRRQFGVVLQNGKLFSGSVFENIVSGRPLGLDDAWQAAQMAAVDEDIEAMPMGMQTVIQDNTTVSGGQAQRLMIARAVAARPAILFLDEATSALDNANQARVADSLDKLPLTRIVVAHRLSTIKSADMIHAMKDGRIVESGTHNQLMAEQGLYYNLAKRQEI